MQLPATAIAGLEAVINRYLRLDPDIGPRLAALSGRCIAIDLRGLDLTLFIFPDEHGIQLKDHIEGEADTVLRGTPLGMAHLGLGGNTEKTLFSGEVIIEGDVETGQAFKDILDGLDITLINIEIVGAAFQPRLVLSHCSIDRGFPAAIN